METIIKIEDKEVRLSNNVAWTMEYRDQFGKDPLETILPLANTLIETTAIIINNGGMSVDENGKKILHAEAIAEALEGRSFDITLPLMQMGFVDAVVNVAWAMAKAADETIDLPKRWVRQFDSFPLDVIVPKVVNLLITGFSTSKNSERLRDLGANLKILQPSLSMTSSSQDSKED